MALPAPRFEAPPTVLPSRYRVCTYGPMPHASGKRRVIPKIERVSGFEMAFAEFGHILDITSSAIGSGHRLCGDGRTNHRVCSPTAYRAGVVDVSGLISRIGFLGEPEDSLRAFTSAEARRSARVPEPRLPGPAPLDVAAPPSDPVARQIAGVRNQVRQALIERSKDFRILTELEESDLSHCEGCIDELRERLERDELYQTLLTLEEAYRRAQRARNMHPE